MNFLLSDAEMELDATIIAKECLRDLDANNDGKISKGLKINSLKRKLITIQVYLPCLQKGIILVIITFLFYTVIAC